ncbi:MAG: cytidine deaminase [Balneolales bacterium]
MNSLSWDTLYSRCYTPYSGLKEVCVITGKTGTMYPGVRIESASLPLTIHAIQTAIFTCLSEGDHPSVLLVPERGGYNELNIGATEYTNTEEYANTDRIPNDVLSTWCNLYSIRPEITREIDEQEPEQLFQTTETGLNINRLTELTSRCITPYSSFPVTALLSTDSGVFSGVNIELNDWQKGLCAERVALGKALSCGASKLYEMHVYAPKSDYASPCGACRQVLTEQMNDGCLHLHHSKTELTYLTISALLPYPFIAKRRRDPDA